MRASGKRLPSITRESRSLVFLAMRPFSPGSLFHEKGFQPSAVAGLRWRLFDFGRVDAEVRQAKGANAEALLQFRSSVLRAAEDVENSFTLLAQSEVRSDEILREIGALQRVRDRSQEAYQAGAIGLTDVLDADRQLLVARDDLALTQETVARSGGRLLPGARWRVGPVRNHGRIQSEVGCAVKRLRRAERDDL